MHLLVHEDVGCRAERHVKRDETHRAVVKEVQLAVTSFGDGCVMTAVLRRAHVIDQGDEFVGDVAVRSRVEQETIEVELSRKVYVLRHFAAHQAETFQLDAEHVGCSFDGKFLRGGNFTFALVAFVGIVTFQPFTAEVVTHSVFQR